MWISAEEGRGGAKVYPFPLCQWGNKLEYKVLSMTLEERTELSSP